MADIDTVDAPVASGEIHIRSTAELTDVRFADRVIELMVMPYNREAVVPESRANPRMVREICMPGAFAGLETRANRVRLFREHDLAQVLGKGVSFRTNADDGLIGSFRVPKTPAGDEALELADEGVLDASAGFTIKSPGDASWHERRTLRRLHKVFLHHVALTADPAYEDARVLAVRTADTTATDSPAVAVVSTPHLAELYARELAERAAAIDRRFGIR